MRARTLTNTHTHTHTHMDVWSVQVSRNSIHSEGVYLLDDGAHTIYTYRTPLSTQSLRAKAYECASILRSDRYTAHTHTHT